MLDFPIDKIIHASDIFFTRVGTILVIFTSSHKTSLTLPLFIEVPVPS
jgi:hypothetical protein